MDDSKKLGPRDVFIHLLAIICLYFAAVNFGVILFQLLNLYLPDVIVDVYRDGVYDTIRWAVATLVIVFPVYAWLNWFLEKELARFPEKRELRTRKWLIYLTLFWAAGVIMGDLVTLVYNFLQGELTLRFVLKILVVLVIATGVFKYYLLILKPALLPAQAILKRVLSWTTIALAVAVVVAGFAVAGLPKDQRLKKLDDRRVGDLQSIQSQVLYFWQQKSRLPDGLDQLKDSISGYQAPVDPATSQPYEYKKLADLKFELCADFSSQDNTFGCLHGSDIGCPKQRGGVYPSYPVTGPVSPELFNNWDHVVGHSCFERKIDPDLYGLKRPVDKQGI